VLRGGVYLITGGTGSFGSTVARHLLGGGAEEVRIFSRDEEKQDRLRRDLADERATFLLGDVRDQSSVDDAVAGVDFIFHAAALKQVPSCEFFPDQAVATNVTGSMNVIRAAHQAGVRSVVCLSTDKAVQPINAMGMSKALMEKAAAAYSRRNPGSATVVSCVRYGNVMYSRGSVIPLFVEQVSRGVPLTVTNPAMTRFLMSLTESVDLVLHAFANAQPGDIFVRKAAAATVGDLAEAVRELFDSDSKIDVIGTRHGEKLFETLLTSEEVSRAEDLGEYYRVPLDTRSLNYGVYTESGEMEIQLADDYTSHNTTRLGVGEVEQLLTGLPEIRKARERMIV